MALCYHHEGECSASPAFNRDALTNRPRISLLDKASFIPTRCAPLGLRGGDGEGGGTVHFYQGVVAARWGGGMSVGRTAGILYLDVPCLIMSELSEHEARARAHTHVS